MIRILTVLLLSALALPVFGQTAAQNADKLGPGDTVHVTVFQQPDLTVDARVTDAGTIVLPLAGPVKVAGLSTGEAAGAITKALKEGQYLKNPQVSVAPTTVSATNAQTVSAPRRRISASSSSATRRP